MRLKVNCLLCCLLLYMETTAQPAGYNYDESKVAPYTLPTLLQTTTGNRITTAAQWEANRPALLNLFAEHEYGQTPTTPVALRFQIRSIDNQALGGLAIRKQMAIYFTDYPQLAPIMVLLYLPKNKIGRVPVFVGLNFFGNHSISNDPGILLSNRWVHNEAKGVVNNRATEASRGYQAHQWPVETILNRGYALATAYYGDVEPDHPTGWKQGVRSALGDTTKTNNWGALGAWAWQLSRMLDYLQTEPDLDAKRAIVLGHSRIGKAALWAGAQDTRFAGVISNESGEGGAALARRNYGETVERINTSFPHWFCGKFKTYNKNVSALPVDQHQLLALIAPRPLYVASAEGDQWSDPNGEFLSAKAAGALYKLYGKTGMDADKQPGVNQPVGQRIRYHYRTGKHSVTDYDWEQYLKFADELITRP